MISFKGYDDIIRNVYENRQEHLFSHWGTLTDDEKALLLNDIATVDFRLIGRLFSGGDAVMSADYTGAPYVPAAAGGREAMEARERGIDYLRQGKVAAFLVAGGQGSRLGYEGPKGKFPVGPLSGKSLFRIHGEKIRKYSEKYGAPVPWLIMTSRVNHDETLSYFRENRWFGLHEEDVMIFPQNMVPSLDLQGKLVLETKCSLFKNPDGHGGSLTALWTSGAVDVMRKRGISTISYFQVDNPLVKIIDPVFIGYHIMKGMDISSKAVKKAYPEEKMGVFVRYADGKTGIVEYSDLPREKMFDKDPSGEYRISMGSVAIHLFELDFIEAVTRGTGKSLPFHRAQKKIRAFTPGGFREMEGLKYEKFVFDALLLTDRNLVCETLREEEFAPVKNAAGVDSVESAQALMSALHRSWLEKRGIRVPRKDAVVEISPLRAVEPGDLPGDLALPDSDSILIE